MKIEEDSTENFILIPNEYNANNCYLDSNNYLENNWEINANYTDIGTKLLKTTASFLTENGTKLSKISSFLNGNIRNTFSNYSRLEPKLNDSQNNAYLKAINSSDFCIIQGPPGTGKTETIGSLAKSFVDMGLKVFITAPTHTAINNCLNAISKKIKDSNKVIKIGEKAQNKDLANNSYITKKARYEYYSSGYDSTGIAIGATAYSLCYPATKRLAGWEFDIAIIDEASQLSIPLAIAAMCRTDKYIFVGDHKQLDPIVPKGSNNEMHQESIFKRLTRIYPSEINLLKRSYRLNESLIAIPNKLFYNNLLHSDSSTNVDSRSYESEKHNKILNNNSHTLVLHDTFDSQGRSPFEAKLVSELVLDLLMNGVKTTEIGIMSPYRAQVREIRKGVKSIQRKYSQYKLNDLFIDTVDSMQGQEKDYIIYSMSNSNPLDLKRRLGFFYSPNRLNVAITRAIKKCIVIGNYKIFDINQSELESQEEYYELKDCLEIFKQYRSISTIVEINEVVDDEW